MLNGSTEKTVTLRLGCCATYGLWALAFGLLTYATVTQSWLVAIWSPLAVALAVTATVRNYFVVQARLMRAAFDYGREQGRADVTRMRR